MEKLSPYLEVGHPRIGPGYKVYIVAEIGASHNQDTARAVRLVRAAKEAGADAVKFQAFSPGSMTLDCDQPDFKITDGPWRGWSLWELYKRASVPWEWHSGLKKMANDWGLDYFCSVFDPADVPKLEDVGVPLYKIASFENTHHELIAACAQTGKPLIISSGGASVGEVLESVAVARANGSKQVAVLKCASAYPASSESMDLGQMRSFAGHAVPGLSDHTLGHWAAAVAVGLGACIIEKHLNLDTEGLDGGFAVGPGTFREMVRGIREAEKLVDGSGREAAERPFQQFRRSIYVARDLRKGQIVSREDLAVVRPGYGLSPPMLPRVVGKRATKDLPRGHALDAYDVAK